MSNRTRLTEQGIGVFVSSHPGWKEAEGALVRTFSFDSYAAGIAFVVRLGFAAEARDHHPDLHVGFRTVKVAWTTHDAGGITALDAELAEQTERLAG